jgi:uncharacterized protein (TIGR02246 family)
VLVAVAACVSSATSLTATALQTARLALRDDPVQNTDTVRNEIIAMLGKSAQAWNRGDLDTFVSDYAPEQRTTFITSHGVIRGPDAIKAAYEPRFVPGAQHDSLSFENVEVDVLAPNVINVIAYYRLMRGDTTTARGPTSLVMQKMDGRWRIIHDHSS